jgi:hypothetical protein
MPTLTIPDSKEQAQTVTVPIKVSTKVNDEKKEDEIERELPKSLGDAVAIFGEKEVFKAFIQSYVIKLQNERRLELQDEAAAQQDTGTRKRAKYLEELGL